MNYVLLKTGNARVEAARVASMRTIVTPEGRKALVRSCRFGNEPDELFRESPPFDVYPSQVKAEYTDEHPTSDEHLNYESAFMHLLNAYVTKPSI